MDLEGKKEHVLRCIKLGMGLYESMIVSECTVEEVELLNSDEKFNSKIQLHQYIEEKSLLEKFNTAIEAQLKYGNTKGLEKKLAKINPDRWDDKKEDDSNKNPFSKVSVSIKGVFPTNG